MKIHALKFIIFIGCIYCITSLTYAMTIEITNDDEYAHFYSVKGAYNLTIRADADPDTAYNWQWHYPRQLYCSAGTSNSSYSTVVNVGSSTAGTYSISAEADPSGVSSDASEVHICEVSELMDNYFSNGPLYIPLNTPIDIYANSNPDYHYRQEDWEVYFPPDFPTWDVISYPSGADQDDVTMVLGQSEIIIGGGYDKLTFTASIPGEYVIRAKAGSSDDGANITIIVLGVQLVSVDASNPNSTKVNYQTFPGVVIPTVYFTAPGTSSSQNNVSGSFFFTYNQNDITSNPATIQLTDSFSGLISCNVTLLPQNPEDTESMLVFFPGEGIGWRPYNHTGRDGYRKYIYSCSSTGKLIYAQNSTALMYFASDYGSITTWGESHRYSWTGGGGGSTSWVAMNEGTGWLPPDTMCRDYLNNLWFDPSDSLTGTCRTDGFVYYTTGGSVASTIIITPDIDLSMP